MRRHFSIFASMWITLKHILWGLLWAVAHIDDGEREHNSKGQPNSCHGQWSRMYTVIRLCLSSEHTAYEMRSIKINGHSHRIEYKQKIISCLSLRLHSLIEFLWILCWFVLGCGWSTKIKRVDPHQVDLCVWIGLECCGLDKTWKLTYPTDLPFSKSFFSR